MSHPARLARTVVAVAVLLALLPSAASAAVHRLAPTQVRGTVHTFDVSALRGSDVSAARLVSRRGSRVVSARAIGRARRLSVRAPRRWRRVATRLVVTVNTAQAAGRKKPGSGTTSGGTTSGGTTSGGTTSGGTTSGGTTSGGTTTTTGGTISTACGFGTFGSGVVPGACWRPYADSSPFNQPIPATAKVQSNSSAIVAKVTGWGTPDHLVAGNADTQDDWYHPTYYAKATDPVFTLDCTEPWGTCDIEGMRINVPDAARPAAGGDGHLTVVDQVSGWEYDLYSVSSKPAGGGVLKFGWGGRTRIDGDGLNSGATAAEFGNLAGIIRAPEMEAGVINHALFMVAKCDSGTYVYPADKNGRSCSVLGIPTGDAPAMGSRFQLAMTEAEINALSVPAWKKTILRAMATYGMYVGDTGGGAWGIAMESGSTYTSFGLEDGMVTFAKRAGVPVYNGDYVFNLRDGVDWKNRLRVIDPCTTRGTC